MNPQNVNLAEAIRLYFLRYMDFSGRSTRSEYWYAFLFTGIVGGFISAVLPEAISWLWSALTLIPGLSISFRRMHDTGKSAKWLLFCLIPIVGWIVILVCMARESDADNVYGPRAV